MYRVYIAGAFHRRDEFMTLRQSIEAYGMLCTSRWLVIEHTINDAKDLPTLGALYSTHDRDDVKISDSLVLVANDPDDTYKSGGRWVEFGIAVDAGKDLVTYDPWAPLRTRHENVFSYLPENTIYHDWADVLNHLIERSKVLKLHLNLRDQVAATAVASNGHRTIKEAARALAPR